MKFLKQLALGLLLAWGCYCFGIIIGSDVLLYLWAIVYGSDTARVLLKDKQ